jgi:hypothetical protein
LKIAKGKIKLIYDGILEGLPFDAGKLAESTEAAILELQKALTIYVQSAIKDIPSGQTIDITISLKGRAGDFIGVTIDNDYEFILLRDGHPYVLGI